jgi:hypothetical protein
MSAARAERVSRSKLLVASLFMVVLALLGAQTGSHAQGSEVKWTYSRSYLLTGNYVASGLDFTEQANPINTAGLATGTIHIDRCPPLPAPRFNCVPDDADIVAAYLYWESIVPTATTSLAAGVRFRGEEILLNDVVGVKAKWQPLQGTTASCWSSGSPLTMVEFRADVLRFLPIRMDKDGKATGKRLVHDADLTAHGQALHEVMLPMRSGNQVPESAGASLVIVYRDPVEPLRKIVFYDGIQIQGSINESLTQTIQGFYQSTGADARVTHLIGSGQPNNNELVFFDVGTAATTNTPISPIDPVFGGSSSQRAWSTLTYPVGQHMAPISAAGLTGFGETVTTSVSHVPASGGYDCLAWGAVIFSTSVADVDHDGLPDGLEDSTTGLSDPATPAFPNGQPLPHLGPGGMGASSGQPDIFIEFNAMRTTTTKAHGSTAGPYPGVTAGSTKDVPPHTHIPAPDDLLMIANAYMARGIRPHFDVGNISAYHAIGEAYDNTDDPNDPNFGKIQHTEWVDDFTNSAVDQFLVPTAHARGGEVVEERACDPMVATCIFEGYFGVVSWKIGLQLYRDAPVGADGEELSPPEPPQNWDGRRRFDRNRRGLFHYVFFAHYRGKRASDFPCVETAPDPDNPVDYPTGQTTCTGTGIADNPDYYRPSSASGVADLPGGNAMVTLGLWDDFVGKPYARAATTFHELGHNLNLWHGGAPAVWGNKFPAPITGQPTPVPTSSFIEPNCKPNYLSAMSYLFQVHGLFDDDDNIHLDFSGSVQGGLGETSLLGDLTLAPVPLPGRLYRTAWYAPADSTLATTLGVSKAKRYCLGAPFTGADPNMARVYNELTTGAIDWDGEPMTSTALIGQDVNFDNVTNDTLTGFNDWSAIRLDQISAGRNAVKFQDGDFLDFGSGDFLDFGSGDFLDFGSGDFLDFGSGDFLDFGSGDFLDFGSGALLGVSGIHDGDFLDFGSGDFLDFGSGDFLDFGSGDFLDFGSGTERQELTFELAKDLGRGGPFQMKGCVIESTSPPAPDHCLTANPGQANYHRNYLRWQAPPFGGVTEYEMARKLASAATWPAGTLTGSSAPNDVDEEELPDAVAFMYRTRAQFTDGTFSGFSKAVTVTAINDAPKPAITALAYTVPSGAASISGNVATDQGQSITDVDSASWLLALIDPPDHGTLTLATTGATTGAFTYTPQAGYTGGDSFTYAPTNGKWTDGTTNMNTPSELVPVTVTINIPPAPLAYGFQNVQNLPPPGGKTFKRGSTVTLKWRFTLNGHPFNSSAVGPVLRFTGPGGLVATYSQQEPGHSLFKPPSGSDFTWSFNWQTIDEQTLQALPAGDYSVQILVTQTNQTFPLTGTITITLVK